MLADHLGFASWRGQTCVKSEVVFLLPRASCHRRIVVCFFDKEDDTISLRCPCLWQQKRFNVAFTDVVLVVQPCAEIVHLEAQRFFALHRGCLFKPFHRHRFGALSFGLECIGFCGEDLFISKWRPAGFYVAHVLRDLLSVGSRVLRYCIKTAFPCQRNVCSVGQVLGWVSVGNQSIHQETKIHL